MDTNRPHAAEPIRSQSAAHLRLAHASGAPHNGDEQPPKPAGLSATPLSDRMPSGSNSQRFRRARGIYYAAAPAGMVRLTAIDSAGHVLAEYVVREAAYDEAAEEYLREMLDHQDPPPQPALRLV